MPASLTRRSLLAGAGTILTLDAPSRAAASERILRVAMTAADIPLTTGGPDNGFEGYRFTGYTLYDPLIAWDLSRSDRPAELKPGLAESWSVDEGDRTLWTLRLRHGVTFHDGSAFDAAAVAWNLAKLLDDKAPHYDPKQAAQVRGRLGSVASWKVLDPQTIQLTTKTPDAFFPYQLTFLLVSSPAQFEAVGRDWQKFALSPSGTGPFRLTRLVPRERAEFVANPAYWDPARRPTYDRLVLQPMPEATTRVAALLSGQVDWIEAPAPDQIDALKAAGHRVLTNIYPHYWAYMPSYLPGSPFTDVRVRKAVNLAIDREGLRALLNGLMIPAEGSVPADHPWFGHPTFKIRHDPEEARRLLTAAGYGPARPLRFKVAISTSGSGQMQPLAMNEFIQQNLAAVGVTVEFDVMEWGTLLNRWRAGAQAPANQGIAALNSSTGTFDPFNAFIRFFSSRYAAPNGFNWGQFANPDYDTLIAKAQLAFDKTEQDRLLAELHTLAVDDALLIWVCHDVNPRVVSSKIKNIVQPQSWYIDLAIVAIS
ncbi:Periplasmic dipeptide transport protein [Methylobacterium crusticola]|uniref:Periplasmic dipeptide transport protein n=1 Tax=Methylobacterium crusticola TaxID=1697972 RepID=A0ABQ4R4B3_9HYPH|nr:ABC transporter substrate-binding protein [Methylobacterium crusticola]GJD52530.1 Periplasmic dipeptide transport protein [Methylobacterium crusticola]